MELTTTATTPSSLEKSRAHGSPSATRAAASAAARPKVMALVMPMARLAAPLLPAPACNHRCAYVCVCVSNREHV